LRVGGVSYRSAFRTGLNAFEVIKSLTERKRERRRL
jgi:hypothetical protein